MFRRIGLFLMVNILVIATISIIMSVFGIQPYLTANGIDYTSLLIFCLLWGSVGSFISLRLSKWMAKRTFGLQILQGNESNDAREVVEMVHRYSKAAGLIKMPEVAIYDSPEVNAFATGPSRSNSLVAVSSGLLRTMNKNEVEGVIAHEVAHIANGDMVTMALIQGIVNAFVMFLSRVLANFIARGDDEEGGSMALQFGLTIVFDILFSFLASFAVNAFSRWREYRADAGSARIAGRDKMIAALRSLQNQVEMVDKRQKGFQSMKINGGRPSIAALLSTHPSLEDRIRRLERGQY
ncbi:MAG: protease HtpX [Bdellovibrionales bacterium]